MNVNMEATLQDANLKNRMARLQFAKYLKQQAQFLWTDETKIISE